VTIKAKFKIARFLGGILVEDNADHTAVVQPDWDARQAIILQNTGVSEDVLAEALDWYWPALKPVHR